ncbi:MAG: hypothetical protein JXA82_08530 [Sedimentisphaerales bacterium]|nr:hypothetical protein [Sedimentisphaerales bacterium]
MIQEWFDQLTHAMQEQSVVAALAALAWGVFSVLLSPCHLAGIPLVIGYMSTQGRLTVRRAFLLSSVFSFGILLTIAVVGLITHLLGRLLGDMGPWANYFVSTVLVLFGLVLLDVIKLPWITAGRIRMKQRGILGAFLLGLVFGIAVGPCTFAFMAPVLSVVVLGSVSGLILLLLYGIGHCSVIVIAGVSADRVQRYLNWNEKSHAVLRFRKACGVIIILSGLYMLYKAR